ncbi:MAG: DUF2804 domain-containing protein [Microbacteriaceae bacterium]|nr:DUF2804 domain-containing protein [Microbacteriaceae bacterium]MCL2795163.1 DUF2804 domain-containing protein [Microbacteriaceae bacterium]
MPDSDSLVTRGSRAWGRLPERPRDANPLDAHPALTRRWHNFRTKEWVGFTLVHPELAGSMIVQDAKYLASAEIYAYELSGGALHEHAANGKRTALALPARLMFGASGRFETPGFALRYDFDTDAGRHDIRIDVAATATAAALTGRLALDAAHASAPLVVSARLDERGGTMFTHKRIYPVSGALTVGEREHRFDPARDFAIVDEHRSQLPYRSDWTWGTFALRTASGEIAGANFAERAQPAGEDEESGIWLSGAVEPLADVAFAPTSDAPDAPWRVRSADGRLDVVFTPDGRKGVRKNFGVVAIDYWQAFGRYDGTLAGTPVSGARGVLEQMRMRS